MPVRRRRFRGRGRGRKRREGEKGKPNSNSDLKRGRSHRSLSIMSAGCEEQEKTWTVWYFTPQEGQRKDTVMS